MLFDQRNKFDLIVYYDQDTQRVEDASTPLRKLVSAIYENEYSKPLQKVPMMLAGGFAAWEQAIGQRGIYSYNGVQTQPKQEQKHDKENEQSKETSRRRHWLEGVVGRGHHHHQGRERLHKSPFDWVNLKQIEKDFENKNLFCYVHTCNIYIRIYLYFCSSM